MRNSRIESILLFVGGLIALVIGALTLIVPVQFHSSTNIDLGAQINLLNEVRAPGGGLVAIGILILLGIYLKSLRYTSLLVAATIYLSYGTARIISIIVDGIPATELILATILELVIGLFAFFLSKRHKSQVELTRAMQAGL